VILPEGQNFDFNFPGTIKIFTIFFSIAKSYIVVLILNSENFKSFSRGDLENQQFEKQSFFRVLNEFR
jgi:hypothetical protein